MKNIRVTFILSVNFVMLNYNEINVCFVQSFSSSISRFTMRHDTPVSDKKKKRQQYTGNRTSDLQPW